jgi:hypothetical protein
MAEIGEVRCPTCSEDAFDISLVYQRFGVTGLMARCRKCSRTLILPEICTPIVATNQGSRLFTPKGQSRAALMEDTRTGRLKWSRPEALA